MVEILPPESDSAIQLLQEKPDVTYKDIGGLDMQKQVGRIGISGVDVLQPHYFLFHVLVLAMVIFLTPIAFVFIITQEIREAVELPLTHFQLYCQVREMWDITHAII